ncbi:XYLT1 [Symbiodinium pilosum]|uniref:XYLT1 protein n=1 Tax=Symbiodinium pilosum TaxID=2952 RepID=A0A812NRR9_SYMPI|nr:XYLT1 [Symbiodinium pilosum]
MDAITAPEDGLDTASNGPRLIAALQDRLRQALNELRACRQNEDSAVERPHFSCDLKDHADVLGPAAVARESAACMSSSAQRPNAQASATAQPTVEEVDRSQLKEELSMAKALLMLNNVSLCMDLDEGAEDLSAAEVVRLKGNPRLIQLLITLKQKVALLNQQYLLLRGDMLYLKHEMNVCKNWVQQSVRSALQS